MLYRYFIYLSYKGTNYHGWQLQRNAHTVQAELNRALTLLLGHAVETLGCGRTDTGVHARRYVAQFDTPKILDNDEASKKLNKLLPPDIAVYSLRIVQPTASARFDAKLRTYKYFVSAAKSPFLTEYAHYVHFTLDVEAMNQAAAMLLNATDFTSFAKLHGNTKTNDCTITEAYWSTNENDSTIVFTITANRFLRNMVRAIVGTLLEVGRGKLSERDFEEIVAKRSRCAAGSSAPAQGLFLWEVRY